MSSPRDDQGRYRPTFGGSSRKSPDMQAGFYDHLGQGRVTLPPLSSFSSSSHSSPVPVSQYTQPRASSSHPTEHMWNEAPSYNSMHQSQVPHATYERQEAPIARYTSQHHHQPVYDPSTRPSNAVVPRSSRSNYLPPLSVPPNSGRDDRWQTPAPYPSESTREDSRSSTASYTVPYSSYSTLQSSGYGPGYGTGSERRQAASSAVQIQPAVTQSRGSSSADRGTSKTAELRATSPYARKEVPSVPPPSYAPPPVVATDEATKKKRKRADATQLKVLNDVYARTAFPSTEERADLARQLDMTPRSVQIWFQNKRQSMRASTKQSPVTSSSHQSFAMPSQANIVEEDASPRYVQTNPYPVTNPYPRSSSAVNYQPDYPSTHRHTRSDELVDTRKQWTSSGRY